MINRRLFLMSAILLAITACDIDFPRVEYQDDGRVAFHVETLGEYLTTISRIRVKESASGQVVVDLIAKDPGTEIWQFKLKHGPNSTALEGMPDWAKYTAVMPAESDSFYLKRRFTTLCGMAAKDGHLTPQSG